MLQNQQINELIGVSEAYKASDVLLEIMLDKKRRETTFQRFLALENDLSRDWFTDYFQTEHGDRDRLKQDYTPDGVLSVATGLFGKMGDVADICAGTGGLTIKAWTRNNGAFFHCEEIASRAIPFLLFNLAIRGMSAEVFHGDTLTQNYEHVYRITPAGQFSDIMEQSAIIGNNRQFDSVIMNPPYSLTWQPPANDTRFNTYGIPPKSKADYAFVLHGLNMMKNDGKLVAILPHGILFRSQSEGQIREKITRSGLLDGVIGLPDKCFLNTGIPVCLLILAKGQTDAIIIDASKEYRKGSKQNIIESENITHILDAYRRRRKIEKFANIATLVEFEKNDFNLNIPRYVDTFVREPTEPLSKLLPELMQIEAEIRSRTKALCETMANEIIGWKPEDMEAIRRWLESMTPQQKTFRKSLLSRELQKESNTQPELF